MFPGDDFLDFLAMKAYSGKRTLTVTYWTRKASKATSASMTVLSVLPDQTPRSRRKGGKGDAEYEG